MAAKNNLIVAGIAGALTLGVGGYFANEWRACEALQIDFGDKAVAMASNLQSAKAAATSDARDTFERRALELVEPSNRIFFRLRERCGEATAKEVMAKAMRDRNEINPSPSRPL